MNPLIMCPYHIHIQVTLKFHTVVFNFAYYNPGSIFVDPSSFFEMG
jgi:hypothetical protein